MIEDTLVTVQSNRSTEQNIDSMKVLVETELNFLGCPKDSLSLAVT